MRSDCGYEDGQGARRLDWRGLQFGWRYGFAFY